MEKHIEIRGKKIFYKTIGKGKPVCLVHGFADDGYVWENQIDFLRDEYQLIVPDLPGSGKSEMIDDISIEGMADVISKILNASQIPPEGICVIGHSMGGHITLALAERYPELLNGFGLFHSSAFEDSEERKAARRKGIEFIKEYGPLKFLKSSKPNLFSPFTRQNNRKLITRQISKWDNFSGAVLVSYYESMIRRPDRTEVLRNAKIPVLFIISEQDTAVSIEDSLNQCHIPERSYIHMLKNSGHMGMLEEPMESNRIIKEFLQNL